MNKYKYKVRFKISLYYNKNKNYNHRTTNSSIIISTTEKIDDYNSEGERAASLKRPGENTDVSTSHCVMSSCDVYFVFR